MLVWTNSPNKYDQEVIGFGPTKFFCGKWRNSVWIWWDYVILKGGLFWLRWICQELHPISMHSTSVF
jgi:hypothetical protein